MTIIGEFCVFSCCLLAVSARNVTRMTIFINDEIIIELLSFIIATLFTSRDDRRSCIN